MAKILQYHFLWRESKNNSVFPLAWLIGVCFLIITDRAKKFLSPSQLAVNVYDYYQLWEILYLVFFLYYL